MPTYDTAYPAITALNAALNNYLGVILFGLGDPTQGVLCTGGPFDSVATFLT